MEEKDFENAAKKLAESEEAVSEAKAEAEAAVNQAKAETEAAASEAAKTSEENVAEVKAAADEIVENAAASEVIVENAEAREVNVDAAAASVENGVANEANVSSNEVNAAASIGAAADSADEQKPELRLDDSTQVIDVDYISVDNPNRSSAGAASGTENTDAARVGAEDTDAARVGLEDMDATSRIEIDETGIPDADADKPAGLGDSDVTDNTTSFGAEDISSAEAPGESFSSRTTNTDGFDSTSAAGFDVKNPQYEEHRQSYSTPAYAGGGAGGGAGSYGYAAAQKKNPGFIKKSTFVIVLIIAMLVTMLASVGITTAYTTYLNNKTLKSVSKSDDHATNYTLNTSDESLSYKSVIQTTQDSVVSITTESVTNDIWMQNYVTQGAGSGVIIQSDGYIITCEHVIEGARKITVTTRDGEEYDATLVGADAANDIAVIKIDAAGLQTATYGDSSKIEVGDTTVVIGNPLGTLSGTVTTGIISALDRKLTIDNRTLTLLQTDASINPGNSGGGMFDSSGNLIGIVEAKSTGSDIDGLGFATPINKAAEIAKNLIENEGKNDTDSGSESNSNTPMIGIMVTEVDDSIATQYGYAHGGLLVRSVTSTQASLAGLNQGDIIYKADGKDVSTQEDLSKILAKKKAGDKLKLTLAHDDGSTSDVTTVLVSSRNSNR